MIEDGFGLNGVTSICPQKTNILSLIVSLNPQTTATEIIINATLRAVAAVARRIINLENPAAWLPAIRRAMKKGSFKITVQNYDGYKDCKNIFLKLKKLLRDSLSIFAFMSITVILIIVTCIISVIAFRNDELMDKLLLWPAKMKHAKESYRLLTAGFVHADYMHLAFNMITFYFFGEYLEQYFSMVLGKGKAIPAFLFLYLIGIVVSCVPSWIKKRNNSAYRSLGASGGVAAIVFAMIYLAPWSKIYLFFAIGIPSILFAVLYLVYTGYMARTGRGYVNHDAHLWGSVFGFVFMVFIDPSHGMNFIRALMHPTF